MMFKNLLVTTLLTFSFATFACDVKIKDNSKDGYACAKVNGKGQIYSQKKDNSHDGYKVVKHGTITNYPKKNSSHSHTTVHHYSSNHHYGHGYSGHYYGPYYDTTYPTYTGSVYTSCAPDLVESNVKKTDALALSLINDQAFAEEVVLTNTLKRILEIKNDETKLKSYFSLVNVQSAEDIAFFVGARDDEFERYEANLIANTELEPALAKVVVSKMIKSLRGK